MYQAKVYLIGSSRQCRNPLFKFCEC